MKVWARIKRRLKCTRSLKTNIPVLKEVMMLTGTWRDWAQFNKRHKAQDPRNKLGPRINWQDNIFWILDFRAWSLSLDSWNLILMSSTGNSKLLQIDAGILNLQNACVVIVKTEWNADIVDALEIGCKKNIGKRRTEKYSDHNCARRFLKFRFASNLIGMQIILMIVHRHLLHWVV